MRLLPHLGPCHSPAIGERFCPLRRPSASTQVRIDLQSGSEGWTTMGERTNIIEASGRALADSMGYALVRLGQEGAGNA